VSFESPEELTTVGSAPTALPSAQCIHLRAAVRDLVQTQQSVLCRRSASSNKPLVRQLNTGARVATVTTKLADLDLHRPGRPNRPPGCF
jgi:hypothetical protein